MRYKFIITGKCKSDGQFYQVENFCDGMSKDEIQQIIKEQNFEKESVTLKKEKIKKRG